MGKRDDTFVKALKACHELDGLDAGKRELARLPGEGVAGIVGVMVRQEIDDPLLAITEIQRAYQLWQRLGQDGSPYVLRVGQHPDGEMQLQVWRTKMIANQLHCEPDPGMLVKPVDNVRYLDPGQGVSVDCPVSGL